jgi:AAA+ superfamily predicted ATPase
MSLAGGASWSDRNQRYLTLALDVLREQLEHNHGAEPLRQELERYARTMERAPALEEIRALFGLSPFERDVLLLVAAPELDSSFPALFEKLSGAPLSAFPTFGLALGSLPHPHWSALSAGAPLRRWSLVEVDPRSSLTMSPLRVKEHVLHALAGVDELDPAIAPYVELHAGAARLPASYRASVERAARLFAESLRDHGVLFQFTGAREAARLVALGALERVGAAMLWVTAEAVPHALPERAAFAVALERDSLLQHAVTCVAIASDDAPESVRAAVDLAERLHTMRVLVAPSLQATVLRSIAIAVERLPFGEQCAEWRAALGAAGGDECELGTIVRGFDLELGEIASAAAHARAHIDAPAAGGAAGPAETIREAARVIARAHLDPVATRIARRMRWDDLVVPDRVRGQLLEIMLHVREQRKVFDAWDFRASHERGLGVSALFTGPSGTGKTSAAEALATALDLDLYRIDLSSVVSKYIGETEKNLRRVFDAAERGTAILLFDEADALFGKRSEVRDSHDRYANVEVAYLLSRIETYRGIAILTSNFKDAIDGAFVRRLRFIVEFGFPGAAERRELWRRAFPAGAPVGELDLDRLAAVNLNGASIRAAAVGAAFAAADGDAIAMEHVRAAIGRELRKLGRNPSEFER